VFIALIVEAISVMFFHLSGHKTHARNLDFILSSDVFSYPI